MKNLKLQVWKYSWNFPILTKLGNKYKQLGLIKFILWLILIWLGFKIVVINLIWAGIMGNEMFPILGPLFEGIIK